MACLLSALTAGCDRDGTGTGGAGGSTGGSGGSGGTGGATGGAGGTGGTGGSTGVVLDSADKINAFLEGTKLTMSGDQIPSHPNGFDENVNFGSATQCYSQVAISVAAGTWNVSSDLGTLNDAPNQGDTGTCDHATVAGNVMFSSPPPCPSRTSRRAASISPSRTTASARRARGASRPTPR
ncbi:MAG: hypothetical protein R3F14_06340 [Polyangiaceae bacterium]